MPHRLELHFQKSKRTGITNRYHPLHKSNEKRLTEVYSVSLMSIAEKTGDYVGLRSPFPRQLEAGHCSPTAQRWVVRTMTRNFILSQSITLSFPHSHSATFPLIYHETFEHRWGIEGGTPPSAGNPKTRRFLVNLWILSFHKKVSPGCRGGEPPCKRNRFAESRLRTNNI